MQIRSDNRFQPPSVHRPVKVIKKSTCFKHLVQAAVAMEQVIDLKRNKPAVRMNNMNTGAFERAQVHAPGVHKLHDDDSEYLLVAYMLMKTGHAGLTADAVETVGG